MRSHVTRPPAQGTLYIHGSNHGALDGKKKYIEIHHLYLCPLLPLPPVQATGHLQLGRPLRMAQAPLPKRGVWEIVRTCLEG